MQLFPIYEMIVKLILQVFVQHLDLYINPFYGQKNQKVYQVTIKIRENKENIFIDF
jgi:hypothetical protein